MARPLVEVQDGDRITYWSGAGSKIRWNEATILEVSERFVRVRRSDGVVGSVNRKKIRKEG